VSLNTGPFPCFATVPAILAPLRVLRRVEHGAKWLPLYGAPRCRPTQVDHAIPTQFARPLMRGCASRSVPRC
jgi:hypothetical protein